VLFNQMFRAARLDKKLYTQLFFDSYDVQFALIKAWSFGLVVTGVGCFYGFHTYGGAEGVGRATTRAVVVGSMVILVLDAFWAFTLL